ncbi:hypothetical protein GCM10017744_093730 [Streptomyces antimycoticus]|uniref:Major facilitator superfamily (MFS) profile domain-containing protein n=1 Tax=Streptomyces antimycoticus TaxID=68175 RepID=A0A4D4JXY8_9ACTN|nr:hypothetical protein SANT12839_005820 [Streptomyces antimycoticus]
MVEGLGAALIVPGSLALLRQAYPAAAARSRAFGVWGSIAGIAASAGPLLGGLLVSTVGWRWVFLINLPVGVACPVLTLRHVAPSDRLTGRAVDWPAQCAVVAAVASLTAALNEAGRRGWSDPAVLAGVGLSVLAAMAFLVRERLAHSPAVPPSLLRSRALGGGAVIGLLFNFGFYGMVFTASLDFQHQRGYSALVTGLALFPAVAMTMFASVLSGRPARTTGDRPLVFTGMLLAGLGPAGWVAAGVEPAYPLLVAPMMVAGFGTSSRSPVPPPPSWAPRPRRARGPPPPCSTPPANSEAPSVWHSVAPCWPRLPTTARGCAPAWPSVRSPTWPPRVSHGSAYRPSPRARRLIGRLAHPAERWPVLLRNVARAAARRRGSVAL